MSGAADWRPTAAWPVLAARASLLAAARHWFAARAITEVQTPVLTRAGVTDPSIRSVSASLAASPGRRWYLHTSPEYCMKRLLAAGAPDIYQICPVFRDGERGPNHQPEFTMIEWYRHDFGLEDMLEDTFALLDTLLEPSLGRLEHEILTYRDVFFAKTGLDPIRTEIEVLRQAASEIADSGGTYDRDTCIDLLMGMRVSPSLGNGKLTAVTRYPASQAALAELDPADHDVALRFEVFLEGRELANGFVELRDAREQRLRFESDRRKRQCRGEADMSADETLIAALAHGLPPVAGVALGFDRLVMAATGNEDIRCVQSFAVLD